MTDPIRTCDDHGAFAGDRCPDCGEGGRRLLSGERRRRLSKFCSGALRHFPADAGLELDDRGWTDYADLVAAVEKRYDWAEPAHVAAVIATDPEGRFERTNGDAGDATRVRAAYGHSVDVTLEPTHDPVPDDLYHGTPPENLESIRAEGLRPMSRQQVHLSGSPDAARRVSRRHSSEPVLLIVDAAGMQANGYRIAKRGRETYTTDLVPPTYISLAGD